MSSAPPSAAGKGGASLVSVAKLVMESAMKAGVPIDNKAAHNYAKQLGKMQTQAKKKGGSLGQVHYSVGKFMASHSANRAASAAAAVSSSATNSSSNHNVAADPDAALKLQVPASSTSAAAAIKAQGGAYGRSSLQSVIANELLKSKAATAVTHSTAADGTSTSSSSAVAQKPKPKVSLRRLVSAAYMPHNLKPADAADGTSAATPTTTRSEETKAAIRDALGLGLDLTPTKKPETRLADSAKARAATVFPHYTGAGGAATSSSSADAAKDATVSLSDFLSRHMKVGAEGEKIAAEASEVNEAVVSEEAKKKRTPSTDKEKAAAIVAENPAAVELGVSLAPPPKKRTTLGSLSATLAAAAAARQKLLEERNAAAPTTTTTPSATAVKPTATKTAAMAPLGDLSAAKKAAASTTAASAPLTESLSAGFKLAADDSPLFGDEMEIAAKKAAEEAKQRKQREAAEALLTKATPIDTAAATVTAAPAAYTIPAAAAATASYTIPKPYTDMVGAEASSSSTATTTASAAAAASAEEWEAQRAKEMEALRKAQLEEEQRLESLALERQHAALGEEWVLKQSELAQKMLADAATGAAKAPAGLTNDFYHKYRDEIFFLRDTEVFTKAATINTVTGEALDADGNVIPTRPEWEIAMEVFQRAASAATITNPLPTYMAHQLRRKIRGAPAERIVAMNRQLAEMAVANKSLAPLVAAKTLAQLAKSRDPKEIQKFVDAFNAMPSDRRHQLPTALHIKAMLSELLLSTDAANAWKKALATIDAYVKVHGPQQGKFERALLRFYAYRVPSRITALTKDVRRHIVEVVSARFDAMKKEPQSRGGAFPDGEVHPITATITPRGPPVLDSNGQPIDQSSVLTTNVPVAIGGGSGLEHRNKLFLAAALRGGASITALATATQSTAPMGGTELTGVDETTFATYYVRAADEALPQILDEMEGRGLDVNCRQMVAARLRRSASAEEANQILEDAEAIKGADYFAFPTPPLSRAVCGSLSAGDFENASLLQRLLQWQGALPRGRLHRGAQFSIATALFVQGRYEELIAMQFADVARRMKICIIDGSAATDAELSGIKAVPDLSDPSRDPLSSEGLVFVANKTIGVGRLQLLNSALTKLNRATVTNIHTEFKFVTSAQRKETMEALRESGNSIVTTGILIANDFMNGGGAALAAAGASLDADAAAASAAGSSGEAEVDMPYTDTLLQHAKERNWTAAVALMPQFPTRVPPQQVGALTLVFNCVLSAAVEMPDVVENVLTEMKKTNAVPNATTFNTVMSAYARSDEKWRDALEIFDTMPANVKDASSYSVALSILNKQGMAEEAFKVYTDVTKAIAKPSPILFGLAIQSQHKSSWENTFAIFKDLVKAHGSASLAGKELVTGRVRKALELNGRTEELAEMDRLMTAPASGGKKQKNKGGGNNNKGENNNNNNKQSKDNSKNKDNNNNANNNQPSKQPAAPAKPAVTPISVADDDF